MLKIYEDSKNYVCQAIKLPPMQKVEGLDNLVRVTYQGNDCLIGKDSNPDKLYLFFPSECQISHEFLKANNLYRRNELNEDRTKSSFFEDNRRVKAIKFKGITSSGFIIPIESILCMKVGGNAFKPGDEFNQVNDIEICRKYIKK